MAQVTRKYQNGGKPTIIKIDGRDYNYDDLERNVWGNFDAHAKANNWDAETQQAVRDYLTYSLAGLKSGELTYGHNVMNGVSPEWESNGTFNTRGKGLFKRDITNDKRAGATLGTAYYNALFNNKVTPEYKAPELKNIGSSLKQDVDQKIIDNNFGGNVEAMQEGWAKLTPQDRYTIFRQALADLNYNADEYKDVDTFNTKRTNLLQLLQNPYTDELNPEIEKAYSALGGYGLASLINGNTKAIETEEIQPVSIEDKRKEWRQAAIEAGINTEQGISDYIALQEREYNKLQSAPGEQLKDLEAIDQYKNVEESLNNYVKWRKGDWHKRYNTTLNKHNKIYLKEKQNNTYDFSNFTRDSVQRFLNNAIKDVYNGKINPYLWRGLIKNLIQHGLSLTVTTDLKDGSKRYKALIIPGSEDYNNETVLAYVNDTIRIVSMHDFQEKYQNQILKNFTKLYNQQNKTNLSDDWFIKYANLLSKYTISNQNAEQVESNKNGGVIKAQTGTSLLQAALTSTNNTDSTTQFWNNYDSIRTQEKQAEIDDAKKQAKINQAIKHGQSTAGFKDYEWGNIAGAGFDILETIGSLAGGAADPLMWVGGVGSLGSYLYADINDPRMSKWDVAKNLGINLGISAVGAIPGLGAAAPIARSAKIITRFAPKLLLAFQATQTLPEAYNATKKLTEKGASSLTNDEWLAIARGIQTISAGTRTAVQTKSEIRASKPGEGKRTIELQNEEKGRFSKDLSSDQYNKIKGKTAKEAEEILGKDFLNDANVAEGSKKYWLVGQRQPVITNEGTSWYSRNIGNRQLKSVGEVKPNERRDWLRAQGKPTNVRSERFYNWRQNLHMPSWMPNFSRTTMADEEFRHFSGQPSKDFATRRRNFLQDDPKLISILRDIREPQTGKRITKKPTLSNPDSKLAEMFDKNNQDKLAGFVFDDGTITWMDKRRIPKHRKSRLLPLTTKINTSDGKSITLGEAFAKGQEVIFDPNFLKQGGSIFLNNVLIKYQQGGQVPKYQTGNQFSNVRFGEGNNWRTNVYANIEADLLERLKNAKTPEEKQKVIDACNKMQTRHSGIYSANTTNGQLNNSVSFDQNTSDYQNDIIKDYNFVNTKGIKSQWINGAYNTNYNRNVGKDGYGDSWDKSYAADGLYGGQTDDRRILGRKGDFDENSEDYKALVKRWQDAGADIYLDPTTNYYMLKLTGNQPTTNNQQSNTSQPHVDPITGETLEYDPQTGQLKAVGNENAQTKSKAQTIGEDVLGYIKNINPADAIALGRALWGENVNNKVTELYKQMGVSLLDPQRQTAILHGNYNAKMLAQELAGKINAAGAKPISSDAGTQYATRLEAAQKATDALRQGNAEDSEMYWKTLQILNQVNNENAAQEVATGNENRERVTAAYNNRLQAEAARLAANFEQIWQPFLSGVEKRYRDEDVLRRQAEIDNWKYRISDKYQVENDAVMKEYNEDRNAAAKEWAAKHNNSLDGFYEYWAANKSPLYQQRLKDISRRMYDELYAGLSEYYGYTPFQLKRTPALATPGINDGSIYTRITKSAKSGGTLSSAERQALKTTNEINKNIRQAARETYKNIREDKREHRKAMALVSQLSADLIKKAIGAK